jgi:hypothetical protein
MKRILLFVLLISAYANAQVVNIPDAVFKAKLVNSSPTTTVASNGTSFLAVDANQDGEIQQSEALNVTILYLSSSGISSLEGIQAFANLEAISCDNNQISALDVSGLTHLYYLDARENNISSISLTGCQTLHHLSVGYNLLTTIDLFGLTNLEEVGVEGNQLTNSFDMSGFPNLETFNCSSNQIPSINVSGCAALTDLMVFVNQLTSINASGCSSLHQIIASDNQLTTLNLTGCNTLTHLTAYNNSFQELHVADLPALSALSLTNCMMSSFSAINCPALTLLNLSQNQLTSLTLSDCGALNALYLQANQLSTLDLTEQHNLTSLSFIGNPLVTLFIKNGSDESLYWDDLPYLEYVCADESQLANLQSHINSMPNALINSYCSFVPGGFYNTIAGTIRLDADNNGCSAADNGLPIKVFINDGTNQGAVLAGTTGSYAVPVQALDYILTPFVENASYFNISPASSTIAFPYNYYHTETRDFCITANGVHPDAEIVIVPIIPARPGFDAIYDIIVRNTGNQVLSGSVNFSFDDAVLDLNFSSLVPDVQNTGSLSWNYAGMLPFGTMVIRVRLNVNSPLETPPVNIGDELDFAATVTAVSGVETIVDHLVGFKQFVVGSFDPNDKTCLEGNVVSPETIGDYLHYVINFENTGNYPAENIVVKDMIDIDKFDIESLQMLTMSHPAEVRITGSKMELIFENIDLEPKEHGNVVFKIKTKPTLLAGNTVTNKADIFFDYNAQITTNTASTTFQNLGIGENTSDASISIYPNPSKELVHVTSDSEIKTISVFDIQGRLTASHIIGEMNAALDIDNYAPGMYVLKIITAKGSKIQKLIKE